MNVSIHPSHWFHHHQPAEPGKLHALVASETFWMFVVMISVLVATIVLAVMFGNAGPSNITFTPYFYP
jgi:hypothetical protein